MRASSVAAVAACLAMATAAARADAQVIVPGPEHGEPRAHLHKVRRVGQLWTALGVVFAAGGAYLTWHHAGACERRDDAEDCWIEEVGGTLLGASVAAVGVSGVIVGGVLWHDASRQLRLDVGPPSDGGRGLAARATWRF